MRLLVDTQVFLWVLADSKRLTAPSRSIIEAAEVRLVSLVSAWEVAIKAGLGKIMLPAPFEPAIAANGFEPLLISFAHVAAVEHLPDHHRDPFDRLLIAQALVERLTLISADRRFTAYGVPLIPA
jgi:PIN domain nuclease of toxin-antitoxin system